MNDDKAGFYNKAPASKVKLAAAAAFAAAARRASGA
jgi:hypothetical protein